MGDLCGKASARTRLGTCRLLSKGRFSSRFYQSHGELFVPSSAARSAGKLVREPHCKGHSSQYSRVSKLREGALLPDPVPVVWNSLSLSRLKEQSAIQLPTTKVP